MALDTQNFGKFRRLMQGAGVNAKYAFCAGVDNSPNVGLKTVVDGLLDDDVVTAVTAVSPAADLQSEFTPIVYAETVVNDEVANAALKYTSRVIGAVRLEYVDTNVASDPLVVTVENNEDGIPVISVQLEQSDAAAIVSTADEVRVAVVQHPEASKLVRCVKNGADTGAGVVTAVSEFTIGTDPDTHTSAAVAGYVNKQGATYASLIVSGAASVYSEDNNDNDIIVEAQEIGDAGNSITIEVVIPIYPDQSLEVSVASTDITVSLATDADGDASSTAREVVDAINADEDASALVRAAVMPTPDGRTAGDGIMVEFAQDNLAGGEDAGIVLAADHAGATVKVEWLSRRNATETAHRI